MRVQALLTASCYAAVAYAQDDVKEAASSASDSVSSLAESVTSSVADLPTFTPTTLKAPFLEQFVDDSRWQRSQAKKEGAEEDLAQYDGKWEVEEPTVLKGMHGDKGLVLKNKARHHAISAKFDKPISNKDDTLVVQYEVKLQGGLECGGAYMKLLQENKALHAEEFSNESPYIIMFGPDKCGSTNKVHFIFRHKNPKTGEYEEKHMKSPPSARITKTTTLYTLIVRPDQSFELMIDGKSSKNGTLLEDFTPAVNPAAEIDDPNDTKPEDWVDQAKIADPEAKKPADWDEDAPFEIIDEEAEKPDDWLEDEPEMIPDPEAEKPEDWDDEEDGDWVAPKVRNPKCDEVSGCGPWTKPMKNNPEYKGKWSAPMIDNPAYKGVWAPQKIANPDFFEDKTPANFEPMGAIGFEIWTMQNDILFDNIYIGHSVDDAKALREETFDVKIAAEKAAEEASKPKKEDKKPSSPSDLQFTDDPVTYVKEKFDLFVEIAKRDPLEAVKFVPEVAGGLAVGVITLILIVVGLVGGGAKAAQDPKVQQKAAEAKDAALKKKDEAAAAISSGVEKTKEEVTKRTNKSPAQ